MADISISCRGKLYSHFVESLKSLDGVAEFKARTKTIIFEFPGESEYIQDRLPRFEQVLLAWRKIRSNNSDLDRDLKLGAVLFNAGLFFDCHEYLEDAWKHSSGEEKTMIQGFIQAAAGFHKLELGFMDGGVELLDKAIAKLSQTRDLRFKAFHAFSIDIENSKPELWEGALVRQKVPRLRYV